jgi:hypothetical protein
MFPQVQVQPGAGHSVRLSTPSESLPRSSGRSVTCHSFWSAVVRAGVGRYSGRKGKSSQSILGLHSLHHPQLDPVPLGNVRIHDDHSLIPAPRRLSNPDIEPDEPVETNIERRSDGHVDDAEVPDGHNWAEETQTLLLSLPAPIENVSPWAMVAAQIIPLPAPSILVNRTVKSGILVAKVRTF